jgi:hypothetical protein
MLYYHAELFVVASLLALIVVAVSLLALIQHSVLHQS